LSGAKFGGDRIVFNLALYPNKFLIGAHHAVIFPVGGRAWANREIGAGLNGECLHLRGGSVSRGGLTGRSGARPLIPLCYVCQSGCDKIVFNVAVYPNKFSFVRAARS
jgi:hypothetical protein